MLDEEIQSDRGETREDNQTQVSQTRGRNDIRPLHTNLNSKREKQTHLTESDFENNTNRRIM